jgi:hypothetical protein
MSLSQGLKICLWLSRTVPNAEPKGLGPDIRAEVWANALVPFGWAKQGERTGGLDHVNAPAFF